MFINKYIKFTLLLTVMIVSVGMLVSCKSKVESSDESIDNKVVAIMVKSEDYKESIEAEQVINDSFKYENENNLEKALECYVDRYKNSDFGLDNLIYKNIIDIELLEDEPDFRYTISSILLNEPNLNIEEMKMYRVKSYVEYKDESIEPVDSGETSHRYTMIKLKDLNKWVIYSIGDM